jgi:hypothetical protein
MGKIIGIVGIVGFIAVFLVLHFYPSIPRSFFGWVALFTLGLPTWIFLEWFGDYVFQSAFFKKRSGAVRILLGVPTAIVLIAVVYFIVGIVNKFVEYAGG